MGVTSAVATSVPQPYMVMGLAGGLPYLFASGTTIYLARQAGLAVEGLDTTVDINTAMSVLSHAMDVQVTYGAVMLSFLGALHWGMEFAGLGGFHGYKRLALGAAPVLYAWPTLALEPTTALIAQWAGFTGLWYADLKATGAGWTPKWYSQYRFYLSILVGTWYASHLRIASRKWLTSVLQHHRLPRWNLLLRPGRRPRSTDARAESHPPEAQAGADRAIGHDPG
jgi:hypothetical protein